MAARTRSFASRTATAGRPLLKAGNPGARSVSTSTIAPSSSTTAQVGAFTSLPSRSTDHLVSGAPCPEPAVLPTARVIVWGVALVQPGGSAAVGKHGGLASTDCWDRRLSVAAAGGRAVSGQPPKPEWRDEGDVVATRQG